MSQDHIVITGLKIRCLIGIFDWERKKKQPVLIDLKFPANIRRASLRDDIQDATDYKKIAKATIRFVEKSGYQLVETLAERLADHLLRELGLNEIFLRVSKPGALRGSQNVGVEIHRAKKPREAGLVFLSLGSNLDPLTHLSRALAAINRKYGLVNKSRVYETSPVGGGKSQPYFWNLVAAVDTEAKPSEIRNWIGKLETREGRVRGWDKNRSRTLDVDLILWKDTHEKTETHSLPHQDIRTKAFVLFPLLEIAPTLALPDTQEPLVEIAGKFKDKTQKFRVLPENTLGNTGSDSTGF